MLALAFAWPITPDLLMVFKKNSFSVAMFVIIVLIGDTGGWEKSSPPAWATWDRDPAF